jgi:hypothetical protein
MLHRYTPFLTTDHDWAIIDWEMNALCTLPPSEEEGGLPLRWNLKQQAVDWLQTCYLTWHLWEGGDPGGTPPDRWRPRPWPAEPYDNGMPLLTEERPR